VTPSPDAPDSDAPDSDAPDSGGAVHLFVSDLVVARLAAGAAGEVPGVVRLRPRPLLALAGLIRRDEPDEAGGGPVPTDGVTVSVADGMAEVSLDVVVRYGDVCPTVATEIQELVARRLSDEAGLASAVTVHIVDIDLDGIDLDVDVEDI
jgi:uncharacterized alkaline shock family protein YloU